MALPDGAGSLPGMERYSPGFESDLGLLAWWLHLGETNDLEACFGRGIILSAFLAMFQVGELWYAHDAHGWYATIWVDKLLDGCTIGLWVREDHRHSRTSLAFIESVLAGLTARFPVILFATRSDRLAKMSQSLGFVTLGDVPYLFAGDVTHVGYLTPYSFEAAMNRRPEV